MIHAVVINPRAGGGRARIRMHRLKAECPSVFRGIPWLEAETVSEATLFLHQLPPASRVLVAGGDGTVNRLLAALMANAHQVALMPLGSGNDLARSLGLNRLSERQCLDIATSESVRSIDAGQVWFNQSQHYFVSSLCAGFDAAICQKVLLAPKRLKGLGRYLYATLKALARLEAWDIKVSATDLLVHEGKTLFASTLNTPSYGAGMQVAPHARIDDGALDVVVAGSFSRLGALAMLPRLLTGRHIGHPQVRIHAVADLHLTTKRPIPLAADGEYLGLTQSFEIVVRAGALTVLAPTHTTLRID
jgi:YegS/Rv2252/BmrU family lipid kinase